MTKNFEIPDSAVEAAMDAAEVGLTLGDDIQEENMRAALEAALPIILGEPVAWRCVYPDGSRTNWQPGKGQWPKTVGFVGGHHGWQYAFALTASKEKGDV